MGNKLFVGNLSFNVQEQAVSQLFSDCGEVTSSKIITDRDSGRSKGFGFFEMSSAEEAQSVIDKYNGFDLDGRAVTVNIAKPRENNSRPRY